MRHILIGVMVAVLFTGCEDKEQRAKEQAKHDAQVAQQAREALLAELEAAKTSHQDKTLTRMGIQMGNGTITIDTNQTKNFFRDINAQMATHLQKINDDMQKGVIDAKEAGIEMHNEHLHIDLNKTQAFFQSWIQQMQLLAKEFETEAKDLDTNQSSQKM